MKTKAPKTKPQKVKKKKKTEKTRILGIDPGYGRMGYGVIEEARGELKVIDFGCLETPKFERSELRLFEIKRFLEKLFKEHKPDLVATENLFFSKNIKTALRVGEARGVILLSVAEVDLPLFELSPQEVKQAVTGYGKATKDQVQKMVQKILDLKKMPKPDDAADALAIAITASQMRRFLTNL